MTKSDLDRPLKQHRVQPVGWGYIDCITTFDDVFDFIDDLSSMGVKVNVVSWWCHCKDYSSGCPHGYGGPLSKYFDGWFSEMWFTSEFDNNEQVIEYLKSPIDETMLEWFESIPECFVPALWLDVPNDWMNEHCAHIEEEIRK